MRPRIETSVRGAGSSPAANLEFVESCLLCGSTARTTLYEGLEDRTFLAAPGRWNLHQCDECGLVYLDPRPAQEATAETYASYYTHAPLCPAEPSSIGERRRALTNGYLNERYGYEFSPALSLGARVLPLFRGRRRRAVRRVRHLRKPAGAARLLDIGCGAGQFLEEMRRGGWLVEGIEPDPRAAEVARGLGLEIHEAMLPDAELEPERFHAATLNHVLEHLRDPLAALREVFRGLKSGGLLSISTPNVRSAGHRRFGRHWLHLDPPRHMALFDPTTLRAALQECGFSVREVSPHPLTRWTYSASAALAARGDPFDPNFVAPPSVRAQALLGAVRARIRRMDAEELAVVARKPDRSPS